MDDADLRTEVTDSYTVEIPRSLRAELQLEPGDTIQWDITDGGRLLADVVDAES
jgi:bifunctional DNA-binding transcriptional regulator/antitoxin component of YhaV-PrlF toxin-antitoxin module